MRTLKLLSMLLVVGSPSTVLGQQTSADPLVGCYRLELGSWSPALQPGNAKYQTPPQQIQLRDEVGARDFEQGQALVRPVIPHGYAPNAYWRRIGSDSVRITWTNGFAGLNMHLRIAADGLAGTAIAFTDVIDVTPPPKADAVARRTTCGGVQP